MGRFPGRQVIVANYGAELPRKWGRKARSIVRQKAFDEIFGTALSKESAAADEWALTNGSEYMGAGVLTGITGNRADGVVWDDLIKGREQADSQLMRQKTWDAYFDDLLTRKKPNAWEIGITTRWHEDDIAGRILPEGYAGESGWIDGRDGNRWYVVCIPAEAERADDRARPQDRRADLARVVRARSLRAVQAQPAHLVGALSAAAGAGGGRLLQGASGCAPSRSCRRASICASTAAPTMR